MTPGFLGDVLVGRLNKQRVSRMHILKIFTLIFHDAFVFNG